MAKLGAYATTMKDILAGKTTVKNAYNTGQNTPGGVLGSKSVKKKVAGVSDSKNTNTSALNAMNDDESNQLKSGGNAPSSIFDKSTGGGSSSSSNKKITDAIGRGWDDSDDVVDATKKSLDTSEKYISNLGKVANQYRTALDTYKNKNEEAIAGNKTLIEKNQKGNLDDLAGDIRKNVDNTNIMLGIKGASGGSASKTAARAIAKSAGKERANILKTYGDETSEQNQAAKNVVEEYNTKRNQSYDWEKTAKEEAIAEFKSSQAALKRLKSKSSKWKQEDMEAESDKNFNSFITSLNNIQAKASEFRTNLSNKMIEYGGLADELENASVNIDAPAELETPDFSEDIDLNTSDNAEDFFDPNNTGKKKVIKGYDPITGEPIYEEDDEEEVLA